MKIKTKNKPMSKQKSIRGAGQKGLILEAMRRKSALGLNEHSTKEEAEIAYFEYLVEAAFNPTKETQFVANTSLNVLSKKGWADARPSDAVFDFDYDENADLETRTNQIVNATCKGLIPANIGNSLLTALQSGTDLAVISAFDKRLDDIEKNQNRSA